MGSRLGRDDGVTVNVCAEGDLEDVVAGEGDDGCLSIRRKGGEVLQGAVDREAGRECDACWFRDERGEGTSNEGVGRDGQGTSQLELVWISDGYLVVIWGGRRARKGCAVAREENSSAVASGPQTRASSPVPSLLKGPTA